MTVQFHLLIMDPKCRNLKPASGHKILLKDRHIRVRFLITLTNGKTMMEKPMENSGNKRMAEKICRRQWARES